MIYFENGTKSSIKNVITFETFLSRFIYITRISIKLTGISKLDELHAAFKRFHSITSMI